MLGECQLLFHLKKKIIVIIRNSSRNFDSTSFKKHFEINILNRVSKGDPKDGLCLDLRS